MTDSDQGPPSAGLRPPDARAGQEVDSPVKHGMIWVALAVVAVLGLVVVLVLPKLVSGTGDKPVMDVAEQTVAGAPASTGGQSVDSRANAEQALQDFLHTRARLELANAPVWGEPDWSQALDRANRGNELFGQRQFSTAAEVLNSANATLLSLESKSAQRLATALDSAWRELDAENSAAAETFFETAISIDADNDSAIAGLQQARVRPELLSLMASGEMALSKNDLPVARAAYLEATELDAAFEPAATALYDINEKIRELAFRDAMSRALRALEAEQIDVAEAALKQAATLKPADAVVHNTREQLAHTRQRLWLDEQRALAAIHAKNEDWAAAIVLYRKVLASVPEAAFASLGLAFAQDRERLNAQFDHYLADPTRVWSDEPLVNAEQLIESAGIPGASEPRLAKKLNRLKQVIIEAKTPRTVTLQSDGLTQLQIYHVGRLGLVTSLQLELRPGTYTIVGSRPGYRDVRQTFTVIPGSDQQAIVISCEEPV